MNPSDEFSRRALLAAPAALSLAIGGSACAQRAEPAAAGRSRTLVAFLSRSGNTRVIAGTLQRALGANLYEIRTATPYPEDYEAHVEQARRERDSDFVPPLAPGVPSSDAHDTIFLGFPIWGSALPAPVRSFIAAYPTSGKSLRPFITHGGFGIGNSVTALRDLARGARVEAPFVMEADQERRTIDQVRNWLGEINPS